MGRFIVARMNSGHTFKSLKAVQEELSPAIEQLTPRGCSNRPCPFMADGAEIWDKRVLYQSASLVVEEIRGEDDSIMRRIVFQSNID